MTGLYTPPQIGTAVGHPNPYVGPRSIRYGQPIYGRAKETAELLSALVAQRIVLLYSPSGAGKSSLVEAALRPELERRDFQVLPTIRVGLEPPPEVNGLPVRNRYTFSTLLSLQKASGEELGSSRADLGAIELADYLKHLRGEHPDLDPCLVFDQFEELFTLDPTDVSAKASFLDELGVALRDRGLWALFSIREDFIAQLDPYLSLIPTRLSARYRLDLLGPDAARAAVQRPAADAQVDFVDDAARMLIDDLRRVRVQRAGGTSEELGLHVEPVQLQVACHQLWSSLDPSATSIQPDDVRALGNVDEALADFYVTQVRAVAADTGVTEREIRTWIDDQLISPNGFRTQVLDGPGDHGAAVLRGLENTHLIRAERHRGTDWFELAHDRLVEPIRQNNAAWRAGLAILQREAQAWQRRDRPVGLLLTGVTLDEAQAWAQQHAGELLPVDREFLEASLAEQRRLDLEQRRARRRLAVASAIGAAAVLALIIVGVLLVRTTRAQHEAHAAVRTSTALALSGQANGIEADNPALAIALSVEAARTTTGPPLPQAMGALFDARRDLADHAAQQIGEPLTGHTDAVYWVAFSPDGKTLASTSTDHTVRLWDPRTGKPIGQPLVGHTGPVYGAAFSPDGKTLASASADGTIILWDLATGKAIGEPLVGHTDAVGGVAFSPDGTMLASAGTDHTVRLWDAATGDPIGQPLEGHTDAVTGVAFSPDGTILASSSMDNTVILWNPTTGKAIGQPLAGHTDWVTGVAFSPDGKTLASGSWDGTVRLWDPTTGLPTGNPMYHVTAVLGLAFSPDGKMIASAGFDNSISLWDTASGNQLGQTLTGHTDAVLGVAFSPDSKMLASASDDETVRLWAINPIRQPIKDHTDSVNAVAYSPDGKLLASASADNTVRLWDAATDAPVSQPLELHTAAVNAVAFSPDSKILASAGDDSTIILWDPTTGEPIGQPLVAPDAIYGLAFSPDGKTLAAASADDSIILWNPATGATIGQPLEGHTEVVKAVAFSPDGKLLASASEDKTVRLWDATTGAAIGQPLVGHTDIVNAVAFSPDGKVLASAGNDNTIILWNPETGAPIGQPLVGPDSIYGLAFSPDGKILASANDNNTVWLWDPATGAPVGKPLQGHQFAVSAVAFSPDGKTLASASLDNTISLWDRPWDIDRACELAERYVTAAQVEEYLSPGQHPQGCNLSDEPSG